MDIDDDEETGWSLSHAFRSSHDSDRGSFSREHVRRSFGSTAGSVLGGSAHDSQQWMGSPSSIEDLRRLASSSLISEVGVEEHFASLAEAVGRDGCRPTSRTTVVLRDVNYKVSHLRDRLSGCSYCR